MEPFQPSLLDAGPTAFDAGFSHVQRIALDATSWLELGRGWVTGADGLLEAVLAARDWGQRTRWMWDRRVPEPRLTDHWELASGAPLEPAALEAVRQALSTRYGVAFDSAGFNLYRDGRDGVAWHADRIAREVAEPVIALLSLGSPRTLRLRRRGGGRSLAFPLGAGDLLVMGGTANLAWEHAVPKVARAGPRVSVAFRHGLDPRAYGRARR
ncbi:MAG: alpha-ketoglutarate-dependent dioxygenase AlkB [Anaeromyxobacteraceae bacterium]